MAFPTVQNRATTGITSASSSHTVNIGTPVEGELLLCLTRFAGDPTTRNFPSGWTKIKDVSQAGSSTDWQMLAYKQLGAGAAEIGSSTMSVTTTGGSAKAGYIVWRITGYADGQPPEVSTDATDDSTTPDPSSLSPSGGAEDILWIWAGGWEGEQTSPPAGNPTNYSNPTGADSGTGGAVATNSRVASAERTLNASSEDPGSWTISASDSWLAWTVAVRPSGTAASRVVWYQD